MKRDPDPPVSLTIYGLHNDGNTLKDGTGNVVRFHGANRSGTEYMCINNYGFFDAPNDAAFVDA